MTSVSRGRGSEGTPHDRRLDTANYSQASDTRSWQDLLPNECPSDELPAGLSLTTQEECSANNSDPRPENPRAPEDGPSPDLPRAPLRCSGDTPPENAPHAEQGDPQDKAAPLKEDPAPGDDDWKPADDSLQEKPLTLETGLSPGRPKPSSGANPLLKPSERDTESHQATASSGDASSAKLRLQKNDAPQDKRAPANHGPLPEKPKAFQTSLPWGKPKQAITDGVFPDRHSKPFKKSSSTRDLSGAASPSSSSSAFRILVFLASLPMALSLFAYLALGPPLQTLAGTALLTNGTEGAGSVADQVSSSSACRRWRRSAAQFPFRPWHASLQPRDYPRLGIITTTAAGLDQILPWLFYHRTLGVELFFIFAEGKASAERNVAVLETIPGVRVIPRNEELDELQSYKPGRNKTLLWSMSGKPCNYELFVRQALNGDTVIPMARSDGVEWLIHIDTDELLYPAGTPDFSLQTMFTSVNATTNYVVFTNYESVVERDDVTDPFLEVTLFRRNPAHISGDIFGKFARLSMKSHNPSYMLTYGNGKSAARMQDGLRSNGAHRFINPAEKYKDHTMKHAAVLHYSYTMFSDVTSRSKRCHCKPDKRTIKKCFFLDFDKQAYIVAATQTQEQILEWFRSRVVWTNTTRILKLLAHGMFARIYTPQVIMRGIYTSGLIEATMKAGEEEMALAQKGNQGSGSVLPRLSSGTWAQEGAWHSILGNVYGLVSSVTKKNLTSLVSQNKRLMGLRTANSKTKKSRNGLH